MRSTFSVNFLLRKSMSSTDNQCFVDVVITVNKQRIRLVTGKRIKPENWDNARKRARGVSEEAKTLNDYLQLIKTKLLEVEIKLIEKGYAITAALLKDAYLNNLEEVKEKTLIEVFNEHIEIIRIKVANGTRSEDTLYSFERTKVLLLETLAKKKQKDVSFKELNISLFKEYHSDLLKKMSQNTSGKHLKVLRLIVDNAVSEGLIPANPFKSYKIEKTHVTIDFLTEEELKRVIEFKTDIFSLQKAKDMFLFGCYTGLAYIDIKTLTKEHIVTDSEGNEFIKKHRQKTKVLSIIPLLPAAKAILEKYKNDGEYLLPIQDNTDINRNVRHIAILCLINKKVTFHTSRHTFASTVALLNGISLEVVAKMMGHTNTRMTSHYAKLVDSSILKEMGKLKDKY